QDKRTTNLNRKSLCILSIFLTYSESLMSYGARATHGVSELLQLINMLAKDYWPSMYFFKFKEAAMRSGVHELEQVNTSSFLQD
ncbi:hypothetical protein Tco_0244226, partial [Tanacetum coccineum]